MSPTERDERRRGTTDDDESTDEHNGELTVTERTEKSESDSVTLQTSSTEWNQHSTERRTTTKRDDQENAEQSLQPTRADGIVSAGG